MFSVRQNGIELDKSKYEWDEKNLRFFTKEDNLVLDFTGYEEIHFKTGSFCIFFPDDAHAPLVGTGNIHKIVFKLAVNAGL